MKIRHSNRRTVENANIIISLAKYSQGNVLSVATVYRIKLHVMYTNFEQSNFIGIFSCRCFLIERVTSTSGKRKGFILNEEKKDALTCEPRWSR